MQAARDQAQQELQQLQKESSEVKKKAKELQRSLETEKAGWEIVLFSFQSNCILLIFLCFIE